MSNTPVMTSLISSLHLKELAAMVMPFLPRDPMWTPQRLWLSMTVRGSGTPTTRPVTWWRSLFGEGGWQRSLWTLLPAISMPTARAAHSISALPPTSRSTNMQRSGPRRCGRSRTAPTTKTSLMLFDDVSTWYVDGCADEYWKQVAALDRVAVALGFTRVGFCRGWENDWDDELEELWPAIREVARLLTAHGSVTNADVKGALVRCLDA